jgi:flagellar biosynthesis/type III secretory pathway protein FliH
MSARFTTSDASILPFQFPSLQQDEALPPPLSDPDQELEELPPEGDAGLVLTDEPVCQFEEPVEDDPQKTAVAEEFARARDEGLRLGLAEGRETGYAAGFAEGANAAEIALAEQVERLAAIIEKLGAPIATLEQPVEEAVAALALEVARCVIGDEVRRSRDFLVRLIREAIAKVPLEMGAPRVMLNPADLNLIRKQVPEIETGHAVLLADDTIELGGALVVADGEEQQIKDRRWNPRSADGASQVNLTLSSRWRAVILTLFDGEEDA